MSRQKIFVEIFAAGIRHDHIFGNYENHRPIAVGKTGSRGFIVVACFDMIEDAQNRFLVFVDDRIVEIDRILAWVILTAIPILTARVADSRTVFIS